MWREAARIRLLLTNDDGYEAQGLQTLAAVLRLRHEVYVVAPDREQSASGHAISVRRPLYVDPDPGKGPETDFRVRGTPADCVKLALERLMPGPPDLILSGINHGTNLGRDVFYSGTVSAAVEGIFQGIPAVALSCHAPKMRQLTWIATFVARWIEGPHFPPPVGVLYNVNFPDFDPARNPPRQLAWVRLGRREYRNRFERRLDAEGRPYFWLIGQPWDRLGEVDTDVEALSQGYVTVTPIHTDITEYQVLAHKPERELISQV